MDLDEYQWEIGGLLMGTGRPVAVEGHDLGDVSARLGDVATAGGDGTQTGYDYLGGRTITLELFTDTVTGPDAAAGWRSVEAVWRDRALRMSPRAVVPLRFRLPGAETVTVYGRPRKLTPARLRERGQGLTDLVATFDTIHPGFFGDEHTTTLTLLPDLSGGLTLPALLPAMLGPVGNSNADRVFNAGDAQAWPVVTFHGPITNPELSWAGTDVSVRLVAPIASDRSVTIDPRPWATSIVRSDGASLAGAKRGSLLEDLRLPPGFTTVAFRGQDPTGTSSCTITWADGLSTP